MQTIQPTPSRELGQQEQSYLENLREFFNGDAVLPNYEGNQTDPGNVNFADSLLGQYCGELISQYLETVYKQTQNRHELARNKVNQRIETAVRRLFPLGTRQMPMSDSIAEVLCKDFIEENPKNELFLDFTKRALVLQRERVLSNFKEYLADANEPRIIHRYCRALEEGCITTPHRSRPDFGLYGGQLVGLLDSYGIQIAEGMLLGSHTAAAMTLIAPLKGVRVGLSDNFVAAYPQHALVYAARINDPVLLQSAMDAGADPLAPMIERDVYLPWDLAFDAGIKNNWGWECARRLVEFHHVSRLHPHQQDVIREALRSVWATDPEQLARASEFICSDLLGKGFPLKEATLHCLREGYEELFLELFRSAREDERPQVIALACESSSDDAGCPYTITPRIASAFLRHIESSSDSTSPIQAELITALRKRATEAPPTP